MDNLEAILQCLNDFEGAKEKKIVPELDGLLSHIAKTGRTEFPWHLLKPLVAHKLERVLAEFFENNPSTNAAYISEPTTKSKDFYPDAQKLISNLNCFSGLVKSAIRLELIICQGGYGTLERLDLTPFTIQRICELITEPKRYYKTTDKFLRGVEKNIMVVSTIQPDGSLITRSVPTVLTNGDMSPPKTESAVPASPSPSLTPLNNTPLNTITQDNTPSPVTTPVDPPITSSTITQDHTQCATPKVRTEEKPNSESTEKQSIDTNSHKNLTQDSENGTEQLVQPKDEQCSENGNHVSTEMNEKSVDAPIKESMDNCIENGTGEKKKDESGKVDEAEKVDALTKVDVSANTETLTDEKPTSEDEKMEES